MFTRNGTIKSPIVPPMFRKKGYQVVSLSDVVKWLAEKCEELGIEIDDVRVLTQASQSALSLNEPVDDGGDSELGDLLEQNVLPDADERVLRESFMHALGDALAELPERERRVLQQGTCSRRCRNPCRARCPHAAASARPGCRLAG